MNDPGMFRDDDDPRTLVGEDIEQIKETTMTEEKGIFAESNGADFEQIQPGSYVARAYKMIDIGTQRVKDFNTDDIALKHEVIVYWEVLEDEDNEPIRMKDNRPFSVQKKYKLSMHPKANLRKDLDSWRGMAFTDEESARFNITKLLGNYCRISLVTSKDGKYTNVDSVAFTRRKPEGHNDLFWWSAIDPDRDMEAFEKFPDWLKDKISACEEWVVPEVKKGDITDGGEVVVEDKDQDEQIDLSEIPF